MSTNNDRELLELAAKAAGIDGLYSCTWKSFLTDGDDWNPLNDDGDAFRLMLALEMMVDFISRSPAAYMNGHVVAVSCAGSSYELGFTPEATRRAIVRAASEIGKAMP